MTSALSVAWFSLRADDVRLAAGKPAHNRSRIHRIASVCRHGGTALRFRFADGDEIEVTPSSRDAAGRVPPNGKT
jgi:hypothetical protein